VLKRIRTRRLSFNGNRRASIATAEGKIDANGGWDTEVAGRDMFSLQIRVKTGLRPTLLTLSGIPKTTCTYTTEEDVVDIIIPPQKAFNFGGRNHYGETLGPTN